MTRNERRLLVVGDLLLMRIEGTVNGFAKI